MKRVHPLTLFALLVLLYSCSPHSNAPVVKESPHPGMIKVNSLGVSFQQGWNDTLATMDERPGMLSSFTYDYWIDTVDVTQLRYFTLTGKRPVSDTSSYGIGNNYPVYNVTWFDAVLFCNARSKAENLDTVYTYSGNPVYSNGSVTSLTGLGYDLTRDGYRLPTEAEWEFAARDGSSNLPFQTSADSLLALSCAWFSGNSLNSTHPVAAKARNQLGLYDMAGNVFQWTNDWKTNYTGTPISNSLGGAQPDGSYEKVIKGGAYNYGLMNLRPSCRAATYPTELSTACAYMGFRCARGPILQGHYIGIENQNIASNPVSVVIGQDSLLSYTESVEAKLVFVDVTGSNRRLFLVDFGATIPTPEEFSDDDTVYAPVISPNGKFVAYCNRDVGSYGPARIIIRSLDSLKSPKVRLAADSAYCPRWWINPATGDTCIVYTNSAIEDDNASWNSTITFSQKVQGGNPVNGPQVVISNGSFHDGISVNGQYALTSYPQLLLKNNVTGQQSQLFISPNNGKPAGGSTQACNGSISPDPSGNPHCLFLDFGSPTPSTITGCSYGIHQYLFISSVADSITNFINCPTGENSWDHPKWTNVVQFAVACGVLSTGLHNVVYLVDLAGRDAMQLITGVDIEQPYLWINQVADNFALDSLGQYDNPSAQFVNEAGTKLLWFWQQYDSVQVICLGSSEMLHGIDPVTVAAATGYRAYNMATDGGDFQLQKAFLLNYILNHCPNLKCVLSSLDAGWLDDTVGPWNEGNNFKLTVGYNYDKSHQFWPSVSANFVKSISQIPFPCNNCFQSQLLGYYPCECSGWDNPPAFFDTLTWSVNGPLCQKNLSEISSIADTLGSHGITWIVINFPVDPAYKNTSVCGPTGPVWQTEHDLFQILSADTSTNKFFHFYDANLDGNHDYGDSDAYLDGNSDHLCSVGAEKLTGRVDSIIHLYVH